MGDVNKQESGDSHQWESGTATRQPITWICCPGVVDRVYLQSECGRTCEILFPLFHGSHVLSMLTPLSLQTVYIWWKCCVGNHATKVNGNKYDGAGEGGQTTDYWQPDIFQQHGCYCLNGYIHITWEDQSDCTDWVKCNHCMMELPKFNQKRDHVNWGIICNL